MTLLARRNATPTGRLGRCCALETPCPCCKHALWRRMAPSEGVPTLLMLREEMNMWKSLLIGFVSLPLSALALLIAWLAAGSFKAGMIAGACVFALGIVG